MTKESTRSVLEKMLGDPAEAERLAKDDFSAFRDTDLTDHERALLTAAALEVVPPETSGFKFERSTGEGITLDNGLKYGITLDNGIKMTPGLRNALEYVDMSFDK